MKPRAEPFRPPAPGRWHSLHAHEAAPARTYPSIVLRIQQNDAWQELSPGPSTWWVLSFGGLRPVRVLGHGTNANQGGSRTRSTAGTSGKPSSLGPMFSTCFAGSFFSISTVGLFLILIIIIPETIYWTRTPSRHFASPAFISSHNSSLRVSSFIFTWWRPKWKGNLLIHITEQTRTGSISDRCHRKSAFLHRCFFLW